MKGVNASLFFKLANLGPASDFSNIQKYLSQNRFVLQNDINYCRLTHKLIQQC